MAHAVTALAHKGAGARARRAFTLIEVLVAMAIFGVGLTATLSTFHIARQTYALQRESARAHQICEAWLEQAIMLSRDSEWIEVTTNNVPVTFGPRWFNTEGEPAADQGAGRYSLTWQVTRIHEATNTLNIIATVTWLSFGRQHSTSVSTYVVG